MSLELYEQSLHTLSRKANFIHDNILAELFWCEEINKVIFTTSDELYAVNISDVNSENITIKDFLLELGFNRDEIQSCKSTFILYDFYEEHTWENYVDTPIKDLSLSYFSIG